MPRRKSSVSAARNRSMAAIEARDTSPELIDRRQLRAARFRFRLDVPRSEWNAVSTSSDTLYSRYARRNSCALGRPNQSPNFRKAGMDVPRDNKKKGVEYPSVTGNLVSGSGLKNGKHNPMYEPWSLSDEQREVYRARSSASQAAKRSAQSGNGPEPIHAINTPRLDPLELMPQLPDSGLTALSLFSGCGGLDLGYDRAGFGHAASFDILDGAGATLKRNKADWEVNAGEAGDVRNVHWERYADVELIHGGPPCQPFSSAGRQRGDVDPRDMWPEFVRAVSAVRPRAFMAENVPALQQAKFGEYVQQVITSPLESFGYHLLRFELRAEWFGVPQNRRRVFFEVFET